MGGGGGGGGGVVFGQTQRGGIYIKPPPPPPPSPLVLCFMGILNFYFKPHGKDRIGKKNMS